MTTTLHRHTRLDPPSAPQGRLELQPPPEVVPHEGGGTVLMTALPMLGSVGSIVFVATAQPGVRGYLAGGMFLLASLGFVAVSFWRQRAQRQTKAGDQRREYLRYLGAVRERAREVARQQRQALVWDHPDPVDLPAVAEERSRVWERRAGEPDFLHVRYGSAPQPLSLTLVPPESAPLDRVDPVAASGLHRLLATHRIQPDLPASFHLGAFSHVELVGDELRARALARAVVCAAVTFHAPTDLLVAVVASDEHMRHWEWAKWLPHAGSPRERDGVGPARLMAASIDELVPLLPADLPDRARFGAGDPSSPVLPHVLLVVDGGYVSSANPVLTQDGVMGVTVLELAGHWVELEEPSRLRLHVQPDARQGGRHVGIQAELARQAPIDAVGDQVDVHSAEALARRLTPLYAAGGADRGGRRSSDLTDLLGLPHVTEVDVDVAWRRRPPRDQLRVPVGLSDDGSVVHLDIKEPAEQGMGPHGLVIGATGSGKSELLRTLVLALALTHSPEDLNVVLVDFKGGATFAGMADLPHTSALITNLAQEHSLVDRMYDALKGEATRRQNLFRPSRDQSYKNLKEYRKAREQGDRLPGGGPLPTIATLFIVIDEFSELLTSRPEFADLFAHIGQIGRSVGMHLLFASQRLEEGRLRGLESNLAYRIALRTFSAAESRTVLGVPDAYELPAVPGLGILRPEPSTFARFKAAYVSGQPPRKVARGAGSRAARRELVPFTVGPVARTVMAEPDLPDLVPAPTEPTDSRTTLDLAVERMRGKGTPAHRIWLPPLDRPVTLDSLLPDLAVQPGLGLVSPGARASGVLQVPLGVVDEPADQRQEPLVVDLSGADGHVAVVGAPLAGKSTVLRTLVASLALTHTPQEVHFYVLDLGGSFASLRGLPHLAGAAGRGEPEVVRRIVAEVKGLLEARESHFGREGIDSMQTYRARRAAGEPGNGYGDVFLLVDGWTTLRSEYDTLEAELTEIAQQGLAFGVHVVAATTRWADFKMQIRDLFGTRLELRLGDPLDSDVDRKAAANVPGRPGRGLTESRHHFLAALPRVDGRADGASVGDGLADLVSRVRDAWAGPAGPRLKLLPARLGLEEVRDLAGTVVRARRQEPADGADQGARRVLLGVDERALAPVSLDVDAEPHLLVLGGRESGKTSLLRTYVEEVVDTRTPAEAQLVVVDYRRTLLGEVDERYLAGYYASSVQAGPGMAELARYLRSRMPGNDVTPEELRRRAWLEGKSELFLVVDDYELVAGTSGSPLLPLVELIPQAVDVGMHLVLARSSGGAAKALYEPVIQSLRDLSAPGLMLPGNPDEGPLLGSLRPQPGVPGRARLLTRARGVEVVQVAVTDRATSPP